MVSSPNLLYYLRPNLHDVSLGSWSQPLQPGKSAEPSHLNSNQVQARDEIQYSKEDIAHIEKWGKFYNHTSVGYSSNIVSSPTPR